MEIVINAGCYLMDDAELNDSCRPGNQQTRQCACTAEPITRVCTPEAHWGPWDKNCYCECRQASDCPNFDPDSICCGQSAECHEGQCVDVVHSSPCCTAEWPTTCNSHCETVTICEDHRDCGESGFCTEEGFCVTCEKRVAMRCVNDTLYWVDSCDRIQEEIEFCEFGCHDDQRCNHVVEELWQVDGMGRVRGMALYADKLFVSIGASLSCLDRHTGEQLWEKSFSPSAIGNRLHSPVVGPDARVYVIYENQVDSQRELHVFDIEGRDVWMAQTGGACFVTEDSPDVSVAVGHDGQIYIPSCNNIIIALDRDGILFWDIVIDGQGPVLSPVLDTHGNVFVSSSDGWAYLLDPSGVNLGWKLSHTVPPVPSAYLGVIVCDGESLLSTAGPYWHVWLEHDCIHPPLTDIDGVVYVAMAQNMLALDVDGNLKWSIELEDPGTLILGHQQTTIVQEGKQEILAIREGLRLWSIRAEGSLSRAMVLSDSGELYYAQTIDGVNDQVRAVWQVVEGAAGAWAHARGNPNQSGARMVGSLTWRREISPGPLDCIHPVTLRENGDLIFAVSGKVLCYYPNLLFANSVSLPVTSEILGPPLIAPGGKTYVLSNKFLVAFSGYDDLELDWQVPFDCQNPCVFGMGLLASGDLIVTGHPTHRIGPDGNLVWQKDLDVESPGGPIIYRNDDFLIKYTNGYSRIAPHGSVIWRFVCDTTPQLTGLRGALSAAGVAYLVDSIETGGQGKTRMLSLDHNGAALWERHFSEVPIQAPAPVIRDDGVVVLVLGPQVMALDPNDGELCWVTEMPVEVQVSPTVLADHSVLVIGGRTLYHLNDSGEIVWQRELDATRLSAANVDQYGSIFVVADSDPSYVYAIAGSSPLGGVHWPMVGGDK